MVRFRRPSRGFWRVWRAVPMADAMGYFQPPPPRLNNAARAGDDVAPRMSAHHSSARAHFGSGLDQSNTTQDSFAAVAAIATIPFATMGDRKVLCRLTMVQGFGSRSWKGTGRSVPGGGRDDGSLMVQASRKIRIAPSRSMRLRH